MASHAKRAPRVALFSAALGVLPEEREAKAIAQAYIQSLGGLWVVHARMISSTLTTLEQTPWVLKSACVASLFLDI